MTATQTLVKPQLDELLHAAVQQRRRVVMTHQDDTGWRTIKGEFAADRRDSDMLRIRVLGQDAATDASRPEPGTQLGVTFRAGHKKCIFCSELLAWDNSDSARIVTLRRPDELQQLQRRVFERAAPPPSTVVAVRFWREHPGGGADIDARTVCHGQLEDLSAGGMRVKVPAPKEVDIGASYRCAFTPRPGKPSIILDALARHREAADQGHASIGFQFIGLETSVEGRRVLERLAKTVSQFQRGRGRRKPTPGERTARD